MTSNYQAGFAAGLLAAVDLGRAGATPDDLAKLLPVDPARLDPAAYEDWLMELRCILQTDGPDRGRNWPVLAERKIRNCLDWP